MSINELDMKVKELRELRRMAEELQAEIDAAQDAIKAHMDSQGVDTLAGTDWKVTWKPVTSSRMDTTASVAGGCGAVYEVRHKPPLLCSIKRAPIPQRPSRGYRSRTQTTRGPVKSL